MKFEIWKSLCDYYFTPCKFFLPALVRGLSLESVWQQISSGFQDSSQYSSRSQWCYSLDGLNSPSDFQFFLVLKTILVSLSPSCSTFFFTSQPGYKHFSNFSFFFYFPSVVHWNGKIHKLQCSMFSFFSLTITWSRLLARFRWFVCISKPHCPFGWSCRIHWLLLCKGVTPSQLSMSVLDMTLSNPMVRFQ